MNLKNGYKTLYEVIEDSNRVFKASTTGLFENAEPVTTYAIGAFKAVFEDADHKLYGVDTEGNKVYLDAINALFIETEETTTEDTIPPAVEPEIPSNSQNTEEPKEDQGEDILKEGTEEV